ncbi:hypothetical protein C0J52_18677 [Blattella germanica]|nr:hypothetical protein C0J52_18677 [Blattella germanica]
MVALNIKKIYILYYLYYKYLYYIIFVKQNGTVESVESPYIQDTVKLDIKQSSPTKSPPEGMYKFSDFCYYILEVF